MSFQETTLNSIYDQLLYLSGQNSTSVKIADAVRLFNYAFNEYTYLALTSDGGWKFDDSSNTTPPTVTYNVVAGTSEYAIATSTLMIEAVHYYNGNTWEVVKPVDRRLEGNTTLEAQYNTPGKPLYYDLDGNIITLFPTPSKSVIDGLKVFISKAADHFPDTTLSNTIGIPLVHVSYLVYHSLFQLSTRTNDQNRVLYQNELTRLSKEVKDYYSRRADGTPRRLIPKFNAIE